MPELGLTFCPEPVPTSRRVEGPKPPDTGPASTTEPGRESALPKPPAVQGDLPKSEVLSQRQGEMKAKQEKSVHIYSTVPSSNNTPVNPC